MLKIFVRHRLVVDIIHEIISFKQNEYLEKYISFNAQKRNKARNKFGKGFLKLINNGFFGRMLANVRNRIKTELIKICENDKIIKQQSKLTFNGIQKSNTKNSSYTFKQNEVVRDKPIHVGFATLEVSKLHMYGKYYDKLQPYFGGENIQLHYIDTGGFVLRVKTKQIIQH